MENKAYKVFLDLNFSCNVQF